MKGIIAEIHGRSMIVIAKNGDFIKCKKLLNCEIGDEVNIPAKNIQSIYKKISTIAASFIILAMLSSGVYAYYTPYSYVSIDINPSLELYINRFDRVIGVHAFNEDAQKVITASSGIKNKNIDAALEQIIDSATKEGYLKENAQNSVMIVVSSNSKKEEAALSDKISKSSTAALAKVSGDYDVILEKTKVETYKKAKEQNISPGKVILADKFKEAKPELDKEKIKHMPLQQAIKEIEKNDDKDNNDNKDKKPEEIKPKANSEKPKSNAVKGNVMNVKELIKEKNEELGKQLEKDKNNNKNKEDEKKDDGSESFNQIDKDKEKDTNKDIKKDTNKEKDNYQQEKGGQDNKPSKDKDDDNSNNDDKEDKNKKQH
jgi:hypothetical protein